MRPSAVRHALVATCLLLATACGGSDDQPAEETLDVSDIDNPIEPAKVATTLGERAQAASEVIEQFRRERTARGDTMAMPYAELQRFLPSAPDGYEADGEPSGAQQNMAGFSLSEAEQSFVAPARADGTTPRIDVKLTDIGSSEVAYSMFAMPLMLNMSMEDDERRMRTLPLGGEHTYASEEYRKDSHDVTVTAVTRYRYVVNVEASGQDGDRTDEIRALVERIVRGFEGK
jgi:hypothetical protein